MPYFGTMMVHLGLADGTVSGAVSATAHTFWLSLGYLPKSQVKKQPG